MKLIWTNLKKYVILKNLSVAKLKGGKPMEKNKLLIVLVAVTLFLTALNLYATMNLYINLGIIAKKMMARQPANLPFPAANRPPAPVGRQKVSLGGAIVKGSEKAPVTLVEFSDYQCPFSGLFFRQTLPQIEKNYIKTGKVKMVFRNYPLPGHQNAQKAAEASECAGEQGKFWEYHDTIFENQKAIGITELKKYAKDLGLDVKKFNECLESGKMAAKVQNDFKEGGKYGVSGTPSFFINGVKVDGAQPYSEFEKVIEKELKK